MITLWRELNLAVGFLTRLPVRVEPGVDPVRLGRCMAFFPLVGVFLGLLLVGADAMLTQVLPRPVTDALLLVVLALATGALHLDGFADLCDGLGGGRDRDSALRIMKDSHVGAFGVVGLVLLLVVKYLALASLPAAVRPLALLLMPVAGRWAPVPLAVTLPYLRGPEGTGAAFTAHAGRRELLLATLTLLLLAAGLLRLEGLVVCGGLVLVVGLFGLWVRRRLGGVTGDVLGAAVEVMEVATLLLILILAKG